MFEDLSDKSIQPQNIDAKHIPEIEISENLKQKIQTLLEREENNFAKVFDHSAVVKTDRNYVFFSNHWLYLAVLCKKYAEALRPYADFFDKKIRGNATVLKLFAQRKIDVPEIQELIPDATDRERMDKFIMSDPDFRPGKCLINGDDASKVRSTKDIIGSCILKKIAVPDASSGYLGNLICHLTNNPEVYNQLEKEIRGQLEKTNCVFKLSTVAKECAKEIVDYIYKIDKFQKIEGLFENTGSGIKVNTNDPELDLPTGKFLRYMFLLPSSSMYSVDKNDEKRARVFENEYNICMAGNVVKGRLTTEWKGADLEENGDGNFLQALIAVVNRYYIGLLKIKNEMGEYYLYMYKSIFKIKDLPETFKNDFSRRYITSLLAKPFVILTGNSGTGKTRISKQFAEYLQKEVDGGKKNWMIVSVGADWTDNSQILGFFNPLANNAAGKYEKTAIVELIESANENKNIPYFLILDEMNLSHVERYFSDFLSHMEITGSYFELGGYDGPLEFPENLFVIGTVNIDETTYMFSPKVLDRANVVEFKPDKEMVLALFTESASSEKIKAANDGSAEAFLKLAREIRNGKCDVKSRMFAEESGVMQEVKNVFSSVYGALEENGFEFAYRTVKEIRQYISAAYEIADEKEFDLYRAVDEQLLQKVLPKIHGNKKEIGKLLDNLEDICNHAKNPLKLSCKKIKQMKGKLATVQYASFI